MKMKEVENVGNELLPDPPEKDDFELENNAWGNHEFVTQPIETTKAEESVIVSPELVNNKVEEADATEVLGDTQPGVLPDIDAKFVKLEEGTTKVIDMKEMMDHIGQSSTMDRDKAVSIENLFGGFFNGFNIVEQYSSMPSQIGFKRAMKHMRERISKEEAELMNSANAYVTLAYDNITALAEKMNNEVVPDVLTLLRDVQIANAKFVRQIFDTRDSLDMLDEEGNVVDVSYLDVEKPREFKLSTGNDHVAPFNKAWNALNDYMKSKELTHFLFKTLDSDPEPYKEPAFLGLDENLDGLYINYLSYMSEIDLYKIYSYVFSDQFPKAVDSLKYIYTTASGVYKEISDKTEPFKIDNDSLDFEKLNKFIVDNSELIRKTNAKVNYANKVLSDLPQFFSIIENLLSHMRYIFK